MKPPMTARQCAQSDQYWYMRREGVIRGPYTAGKITRYLLLGRIRLDDELSQDRESWVIASCLDSLLPPELTCQSCWDDFQKLVMAQMKVDERKGDRRSGKCKHYLDRNLEQRTSSDRRSEVDNTLLCQHMMARSLCANRQNEAPRYRRTFLLVLLLTTLMLAWLNPIQS